MSVSQVTNKSKTQVSVGMNINEQAYENLYASPSQKDSKTSIWTKKNHTSSQQIQCEFESHVSQSLLSKPNILSQEIQLDPDGMGDPDRYPVLPQPPSTIGTTINNSSSVNHSLRGPVTAVQSPRKKGHTRTAGDGTPTQYWRQVLPIKQSPSDLIHVIPMQR